MIKDQRKRRVVWFGFFFWFQLKKKSLKGQKKKNQSTIGLTNQNNTRGEVPNKKGDVTMNITEIKNKNNHQEFLHTATCKLENLNEKIYLKTQSIKTE